MYTFIDQIKRALGETDESIVFKRSFRLLNRNGERGFSLPEVMVALGISMAVVYGTSTIFIDSSKNESAQERQFWLAARRMEIQSLIRSDAGWNTVLATNPQMACFTNGTSCAAFTTPQKLKLLIDTTLLNGANAATGMANNGNFCTTFNATAGSAACPVGISLQWTALCDTTTCMHAQPKVTISFKEKVPNAALNNLTSYDLVVFKDPKLESLNDVCTAMGGTLTGITCSIASLATACDPSNALGAGATFPLGFTNTGSVICGKPAIGSCASSDVVTGLDSNGGIVCGPACL